MELDTASAYVDLDALFDTRAATLIEFGAAAMERCFTLDYYHRISDEFEGIPTEDFQAAYRARNVLTLKRAMVTPIVRLIQNFARQTQIARETSPFQCTPSLDVNLLPYQLDATAKKHILSGIRAVTRGCIDIRLIETPLTELLPSVVKQNYVMLFMYSYWEWLDAQSVNGGFAKTTCPAVTLAGPKLLKSKDALRQLTTVKPFTAVETYTAPFIKLELISPEYFSVDIERYVRAQIKAEEKTAPPPASS